MRWWGRLLLVLTAEALLFGAYALEARPATFVSRHPPWPVYVLLLFLLVVVVQGAARWTPRVWGVVWLLGTAAAFAGVWGAVPVYVAHVSQERTVTVVQAEREVPRGASRARTRNALASYSVAEVRVAGDTGTRRAYLAGNWSERAGATTTVREDPLGVAGLQTRPALGGLQVFWFVLWVPSFVVLQIGLVAIVFRRGPSLVAVEGKGKR